MVRIRYIFRRLSISTRNLMDYCVIAINEASGSSSSNKFDVSSCEQPVWLLGHLYELPQDSEKLIDDIRSKLWITYRKNFPPIDNNTRYTTDRGFGCMIRCGQMVLANALLQKNLGREWRWCAKGLESNPDVYSKVLKLFQDKEASPYSIHNIIRVGQQEGKVVGEWFGPNTISQALKRISMALTETEPINSEVVISIDAALDNVVVVDEIKTRFMQNSNSASIDNTSNTHQKESVDGGDTKRPSNQQSQATTTRTNQWTPGLLFIQLRLGLTKINPLYFSALKKTFQFKNSLGIIGGRPNHALYLVGYADEDIIYLDPHSTQLFIDLDLEELEQRWSADVKLSPIDSTYHCACPEKMPLDKLDPSLALCFYFHTEAEFDEWCQISTDLLIKSEQAPMFEITKSRPSDWNVSLTSTIVKSNYHNMNVGAGDKKSQMMAQSDLDKFSILRVAEGANEAEDFELKTVERSASDNSQTTNDDEFEMLG